MKILPVCLLLAIAISGCALVDWHCTKDGQWSSYYATGDGRCTYFCADREEKFCSSTPIAAEALQAQAYQAELERDPEYQRQLEEGRALNLRQDREMCKELGFKEDTDGMANCLLVQHQNRVQDSRDNLNNLRQTHQQQLMKQAEDRQRLERHIEKATSKIRPTIRCYTLGNTTTCN